MPERQDPTTREVLAGSMRDVSAARERLRAARDQGIRSFDERPLRMDLLDALEGYAAAIIRCGAPVPHRIRAEIDLYRSLEDRR